MSKIMCPHCNSETYRLMRHNGETEIRKCECGTEYTARVKPAVKTLSQTHTEIEVRVGAAEPITSHEGKKYLRKIRSCVSGTVIEVDVYDVIRAFGVTCPAQAHAIKKLLCAGKRGKGEELEDLIGCKAAVNRAIEEAQRDRAEAERADKTPAEKLAEPPGDRGPTIDTDSFLRS